MSDEGKNAAIKALRREVGFCCPICGSPFLTWHHFDPPWHVEQHWRPEGIIALCPICHGNADDAGGRLGAYTPDELRAMKRGLIHVVKDVRARFPTWQGKECLLVRIGGCYTDTSGPAISINGIPQISLGRDDAGLLNLTFELRNRHGALLGKMEDNWFTAYPDNIHDMTVTPKTNKVKVWLGDDDLGLEFSFERMTLSQLDELLAQDFQKVAPAIEEPERGITQQLEAALRALRGGQALPLLVLSSDHCPSESPPSPSHERTSPEQPVTSVRREPAGQQLQPPAQLRCRKVIRPRLHGDIVPQAMDVLSRRPGKGSPAVAGELPPATGVDPAEQWSSELRSSFWKRMTTIIMI
jgi:hypothetical protein